MDKQKAVVAAFCFMRFPKDIITKFFIPGFKSPQNIWNTGSFLTNIK